MEACGSAGESNGLDGSSVFVSGGSAVTGSGGICASGVSRKVPHKNAYITCPFVFI